MGNSRSITKEDVKWMDTDNADATRSTYHGYYGRVRQNQYFGDYEGNSALCNKKYGISEDGEGFLPIDKVDDDGLKRERVCQRCLKIYDKL